MTKTPIHKVRTQEEKTAGKWASIGYAVKPGKKGRIRWTNQYCQHTAIFYGSDEVEPDEARAADLLEELRQSRLQKRKEERAKARREREQMKETWKAALSKTDRIVVFDTETSGLRAETNVILSLSWQVLDGNLRKLQERTHFFEWPEDETRVEDGAIEVNGLTQERLAELGTTNKAEALREFAEVARCANLLVAHNGQFDKDFILAEAAEHHISVDMSAPLWDTMKRTTHLVGIRNSYGYKWPKLYELAEKLKIREDDIDFHQSASDVEMTARCFRAIAKRGLLAY